MHNKAKPTPIKYCQFCGKKLERKDYGRRLEDLGVFNRRKYCDVDCMRKAFVKQGDNGQKYSQPIIVQDEYCIIYTARNASVKYAVQLQMSMFII